MAPKEGLTKRKVKLSDKAEIQDPATPRKQPDNGTPVVKSSLKGKGKGEVPKPPTALERAVGWLVWLALWIARLAVLGYACWLAVDVRMHPVRVYGLVIHEFDPWFNFRATEYFVANGWSKFFSWYDTMVWSPLGRPVGTTIFPGIQITSACIYWVLNFVGQFFDWSISLNDVCVYVPAGFGALTTFFTFLLGWEVSGYANVGVIAALIMSVLPAHSMRSVAGGYDNEAVAVFGIVAVFYFWVRSVRTEASWKWGIATGLAYIFMAAAWGGYVFVVNMVGVHAALMVGLGRFSPSLHHAYSLFFIIGTAGAIRVPIIGMAPFKSLEQIGPLGVFGGLQVLQVSHMLACRFGKASRTAISVGTMVVLAGAAALAVQYLLNSGVEEGTVWDLSVRVKSLFIPHTKTGNPLVDSVAEHQSTPTGFYENYLHYVWNVGPVGLVLCVLSMIWAVCKKSIFKCSDKEIQEMRIDGKLFIITYCIITVYFAHKMIRLILLLAPAASVAAAIGIALPFDWGVSQIFNTRRGLIRWMPVRLLGLVVCLLVVGSNFYKIPISKKPLLKHTIKWPIDFTFSIPKILLFKKNGSIRVPKRLKKPVAERYFDHGRQLAEEFGEPQVMIRGRKPNGEDVIIDDFREGYWWLRDNTPPDARILSWWDYGYQITGIGNRTTIADGNTWNHEHIALLGRSLVLDEDQGHAVMKHLADYVLIWTTRYAGMRADDLAKSPHMARIAGSVYSDIDPSKFNIDYYGKPSPMMQKSVLFRLHSYKLDPEHGNIKLKNYQEVYTTKNRMMRIYKILRVSKESKNHPFGSYPPALKAIFAKAKDFTEVKRLQRLKARKFD